MSGSSSDTAATLNKAFSQVEISQSSQIEVYHALVAYVDKHNKGDESSIAKIQEELRKTYKNHVETDGSKLGLFLACLKALRPSLGFGKDMIEWFDTVIVASLQRPHFNSKSTTQDAQDLILDSLVYEEDDPHAEAKAQSAAKLARRVISEYHSICSRLIHDGSAPDPEVRNHAQRRLRDMIAAYGRRKPKDLFLALDEFLLQPDTRIDTLYLLSEWLQKPQPHLDIIAQTPVMEHLLKCLMNDRSTAIMQPALHCLIMLLPHIPVTVSSQLPRLFLIYSRCLCWEKFSASSSQAQKDLVTDDRVRRMSDVSSETLFTIDPFWKVVNSVPGTTESSAPELLTYFTYLYGLYPLNFTNYIRKPRKYLKNINFPGADEFDLDQAVIRNRSEQFQRLHLIHPSFFSTTAEEEITENRWLKAEPEEVSAECLSLYAGHGNSTESSQVSPPHTVPPPEKDGRWSTDTAYLQAELISTSNELVFQKYLTQQHVASIAQLRKERMKEVTMEAETATLIASNKLLERRLAESHKLNDKMQKETQTRKTHYKQSEEQLQAKIKTLRSTVVHNTDLEERLKRATTEIEQLRDLVVEGEAREIQAQEQLKARTDEVEATSKGLHSTQHSGDEVHHEQEVESAKQELDQSKKAFSARIADLESRLALAESEGSGPSGEVTELHSRLADAQTKQLSLRRAWNKANQELQELKLKYEELAASVGESPDVDDLALPTRLLAPRTDMVAPYATSGQQPISNGSSFPPNRPVRPEAYVQRQDNSSPLSRSEGTSSNASPFLNPGWERSVISTTGSDSSHNNNSLSHGVGGFFHRGGSQSALSIGSDEASTKSNGEKKAVRVYGRGGAQNVKKNKDKADK